MFDFGTLYLVLKMVLVFVLLIVLKALYEYIYRPLKYRARYGKYQNVIMTNKFVPLLGDLSLVIQNEKDHKSKFHHNIEDSLENKGFDIQLFILGSYVYLDLCSMKAFDEFEKLVPSKIDRDDMQGIPVVNIIGGSLGVSSSDEKWAQRRKEMGKLIGINFCSQHIPLMIETMDKYIEQSPLNQEISFTKMFAKVTFEIITKIFFGKDITEGMEKMEYVCPRTGGKSMLAFGEFFPKISFDQIESFFDPIGKILSFLSNYNLIEPYKSNAKNIRTLNDSLSRYLDNSQDKESVYQMLYKSGNFTKHECLKDALLMLFAGFDTTSRGLSSTVILLKQNPEKLQKLYQEIETCGIRKITDVPREKYKSIYDECDYLNYVLKESLRLDPPVIHSLTYKPVEDCEICGVKIFKGDRIEINTQFPHYNPEQWHRPEEFLPERFDPQDALFFKPGTTELRHPKSLAPFTFGSRNCLGQTLAKLEIKVLLCRFLTKLDFEIQDSLLQNDKLRYNITDGRHLYGTIINKI